MSDAEVFGWKLCTAIVVIVLIVFMFASRHEEMPDPQTVTKVTDTIVINDTTCLTDTVYVYKKSKPDTIYINTI